MLVCLVLGAFWVEVLDSLVDEPEVLELVEEPDLPDFIKQKIMNYLYINKTQKSNIL